MIKPKEVVKFGKELMPSTAVFRKTVNQGNIYPYQPDPEVLLPEKFIFVIDAFEWMDEESGVFYDSVTAEVIAPTEAEAMSVAMAAIRRPYYRTKLVKQFMGD